MQIEFVNIPLSAVLWVVSVIQNADSEVKYLEIYFKQ